MGGAERTVKAVVTSYVHPDGAPRIALRGEVVSVHPDHLAAFDKGEAQVPEPKADLADVMEVSEPLDPEFTPEEPPRSGKGSGLDAWATYARQLGHAIPDDASRDDVIALVDDK